VDATHGRGKRIASRPGPAPWRWSLSPDGNRLLLANQQARDAVEVLEIGTGESQVALRQPDTVIKGVAWLDDNRSFIAVAAQYGSEMLTRVDQNGRAKTIWTTTTQPIGRLLVLADPTETLYFDTGTRFEEYWLIQLPATR
jgi:hypothetical protein